MHPRRYPWLPLLALATAPLAGCSSSGETSGTLEGAPDAGAPVDGSAGSAGRSDNGGTSFGPAPSFPGAGTVGQGLPISAGIHPDSCGVDGAGTGSGGGDAGVMPIDDGELLCFFGDGDEDPPATIEYVTEVLEGQEVIHIRVTFDPRFADNTYGDGAIGWKRRGRTFRELVRSDHVELKLYDADGELALHFKLDYIDTDPDAPSGYSSLGVVGGDGRMYLGDSAQVVAATSSLARNLNACGYSTYTEHSPTTDDDFSPNPETPAWDYRMVYDVWVSSDAFGSSGFGMPVVEYVHASPAKASNDTIWVEPKPCPPDWPGYPECFDGPDGIECGDGKRPPPETDEECFDGPDGIECGGSRPTLPPPSETDLPCTDPDDCIGPS